MSIFAVVHDLDDPSRAFGEISHYLALRHQRSSDVRCEPLIGIWIDSHLSPELAARLHEEAPVAATQLGQMTESVSLGAVWTLCSLAGEAAPRVPLIDALLEVSSSEDLAKVKFVPVFRIDCTRSDIDKEINRLQLRSPPSVASPVYQDTETGRLVLPEDFAS